MLKRIKLLASIFIVLITVPNKTYCQNTVPEDFEFAIQWGTYGHFRVSSKEGKVYQCLTHGSYSSNPISFTKQERQLIWDEINKIDIYSYPDTIASCTWEFEYKPKFEVYYYYNFDEETGLLDSSAVDTLWEFNILHCGGDDIAGLESEYFLTVYHGDEFKNIGWECGYYVYLDLGKKEYIINQKIKKLFNILDVIIDIVENKEAYKTLPESHCEYL